MLDCHCHILPSVDDGASDLSQSIAMLQAAQAIGITQIVATPHIKHIPAPWNALQKAFTLLQPEAAKRNITLTLGCELFAPILSEDQFHTLSQFCISGTNRILIEFHPQYVPLHLAAYLDQFFCRNFIPILAHPERYNVVQDNPLILQDAVQMGCLLQINGRSLSSNPLDKRSRTAKKLLQQYPSSFLSSDAHCPEHYTALAKAQRKYHRMRRDLP